jgi:hypothetical protein
MVAVEWLKKFLKSDFPSEVIINILELVQNPIGIYFHAFHIPVPQKFGDPVKKAVSEIN